MQIHFVGIKGVGMTPLALIAKEAGFAVTGSDVEGEFITDAILKKAKIVPFVGFAPEHIKTPDLVITTGAHGGYDNIEVKTAKEQNIKVLSQGEAVGVFMEGTLFGKKLTGISVSGVHGKTTTSAMMATILAENKFDPSFVIGTGDVSSLGTPGHFGKGKYFVAEADEYATEPQHDKRAKFLWQHPKIAIITNIEHDHPDIYPSLAAVSSAFLQFASQLPSNGILIACGDDPEIKKLLHDKMLDKKRAITYGFSPENDYVLQRVHISGEQMFFWVEAHGTSLGEFVLRVVGEHNALNALAAIIASHEIGISLEKIRKGLLAFQGSKRRLEFMGDLATGAKVYDDYAHHPTEIKKTLAALRKQYPKKKIICIFQPHTYSRTKVLFNDFLQAFESVDTVLLTDIYASLREQHDPSVSSALLGQALQDHHREVYHLPQLIDVVQYIDKKRLRSDTVVVTMGAGDVYKIHSKLRFL
jgi:UDP-N-acetylmuramate--alanine ligase